MRPSRSLRAWVLSSSVLVAAGVAAAQTSSPFQPQVYQQGKDVVWVPTAETLVAKMLDLAQVTPDDFVIDLGSGDGRTVIAAAKRGAKALGVEYNGDMIALSRRNAIDAGVADRATFVHGDLFDTDLSKATVVTLFLLPELNLRLRPRLLDLPPGTRIVSNSFTMEDWPADETAAVADDCTTWCTALLWIVPARVGGQWRMAAGELTLAQEFQLLSGSVTSEKVTTPITNGRMRGNEIRFSAGETDYIGRVDGDAIEGTVAHNGARTPWHAARVRPSSRDVRREESSAR